MFEARLNPYAYWEDCSGERHYFQEEGNGADFAYVSKGHVWYLTLGSHGSNLDDGELLAFLEVARDIGVPGIDLYQTFAWSDAASTVLAQCTELEALCLGWSAISPPDDTAKLTAGLAHAIAQLKSLRVLELQNFPAAEASEVLRSAPKSIERLILGSIDLDREAVQAVLDLPRLSWLTLDGGVSIPAEVLAELLAMRSLRRFDGLQSWQNTAWLRAALNGSEVQMLSVDNDELALELLSTKPESLKSFEGLALSVRRMEPEQLAALLPRMPRLKFLGLYDVKPGHDWVGTIAATELPELQLVGLDGELDTDSFESLDELLERDSIRHCMVRGDHIQDSIFQWAQSQQHEKLIVRGNQDYFFARSW